MPGINSNGEWTGLGDWIRCGMYLNEVARGAVSLKAKLKHTQIYIIIIIKYQTTRLSPSAILSVKLSVGKTSKARCGTRVTPEDVSTHYQYRWSIHYSSSIQGFRCRNWVLNNGIFNTFTEDNVLSLLCNNR